MRAVVLAGPGNVEMRSLPMPQVRRSDDVLIRVQAAGICGTDLHAIADPERFQPKPGVILGHEFTGIVAEIGMDVGAIRSGDRVVVEPNVPCLTCVYCQRGLPNHCQRKVPTGFQRDGGWAEFVVMPARMVHVIPASLPVDLAVLAEPLSCVLGGTDKVSLQPGQSVVILGGGPIGLLYLRVLKAAGAREVIVVEPRPERAEVALALGATCVVDPLREDASAIVVERTDIGADAVIDAVGNQLEVALRMIRRGGTIVLFGINRTAQATVAQFDLAFREIRIVGSLVGPHNFGRTIQVLQQGVIDAERLVSHRLPLEKANAAIHELHAGRGVKIILDPTLAP